MPSFADTYNLSILAIPAYHILSVLPHSYALNVATQGQLTRWDNRNPRSTVMKTQLREHLGADTYAKYERLEACHANGMENLPLFATAIVLGNVVGLKKEGFGGMPVFAASYLVVRAVYTLVFIANSTQGLSLLRSGLWATSVGLCFRVIFKAAKALGGATVSL